MGDDEGDGFFIALVLICVASVFAGVVFYGVGHTQGVKAHASGRYTVVQMPDGTEQVCEVKTKEPRP